MANESFDPSKSANQNTAAQQSALAYAKRVNPSGKPIDDPIWDQFNKPLPYPGVPHDGSAKDLANTKQMMANQNNYNSYKAAIAAKPGFFDKLIPMIAIGMATAGVGAGVGGAVSDAAVAAGSSATTGAIAGGAAGGATAGGLGAAVQGQGLGNIGKSALIGGLGGGLGAAASPASSAISSSTGLSPSLASGLVRGAIGAGTGAVGAKLTGGNAGNAALLGGLGGFASGASGSSSLGKLASGLGGYFLGGGGSSPSGTSGVGSTNAGSNFIGQGNNGNMASTDSTLASTITGALPGLLQAGATGGASMAGANARVNADQNAITTQQSTLGNINNIWQPQRSLGQGADASLGSALGTNGQPANYSGFANMPGYQFAVQQGTQAIQRQATAMGNAYTPNTAAAVGQYVTGTAMQDYNTYINQLMGAAGLGSTANAGVANPTMQTGENISQLQQNIGNAQASGYSGVGSAVGGLFSPNGSGSSLIGAAGRFLGGGSSGGGGPNVSISPPMGGGYGAMGNTNYGVDPSTGQPWTSGVMAPAFDSSNVEMPTMPSIDTGENDFGGGIDYGSGDMNFLGDLGGP